MRLPLIPLTLVASLFVSACSSNPNAAPFDAAQTSGLKRPHHPEPHLLCSGQPTPEQFRALADAGVRTFINLRSPGEKGTGWESERAKALGVAYRNLPIAGAANITEESARALDALLAQAESPVLLYCGSSNRAGALYGLRAFTIQGRSAEESLALAKSAGVTRLELHLRTLLGLPPSSP